MEQRESVENEYNQYPLTIGAAPNDCVKRSSQSCLSTVPGMVGGGGLPVSEFGGGC